MLTPRTCRSGLRRGGSCWWITSRWRTWWADLLAKSQIHRISWPAVCRIKWPVHSNLLIKAQTTRRTGRLSCPKKVRKANSSIEPSTTSTTEEPWWRLSTNLRASREAVTTTPTRQPRTTPTANITSWPWSINRTRTLTSTEKTRFCSTKGKWPSTRPNVWSGGSNLWTGSGRSSTSSSSQTSRTRRRAKRPSNKWRRSSTAYSSEPSFTLISDYYLLCSQAYQHISTRERGHSVCYSIFVFTSEDGPYLCSKYLDEVMEVEFVFKVSYAPEAQENVTKVKRKWPTQRKFFWSQSKWW